MDNFDVYKRPCDFIDWIETTKEHWQGKQDDILKIIAGLEWIYPIKSDLVSDNTLFFPNDKLDAMIMSGLQEIADGYKVKKLSAVATSQELAPFGFLGMQDKRLDAYLRIYVIDTGSEVSCLCVQGWTITALDEVKASIERVIQSRRARGATSADITSWLIGCKEGAWKNNPEIIGYIDNRVTEILE